jgi:hypothetical protein
MRDGSIARRCLLVCGAMKKPSLKREKKPTAQELAEASPFDPVPVKMRAPKPEKQPKPKKEPKLRKQPRQPTPQELAAASAATAPASQPGSGKQGGRLSRLGGALGRPFRAAGRKLAGLRGPVRIGVYLIIAVVVIVGALKLRGGRDDAKLVRETLNRYEKASRDKDYQTLCDDLFASSYVKQTASGGLPCEVALRTALANVHNPTLKVLSVEVNGDRAAASVMGSAAGQVPGKDVYTLVRENGSWRILPPRPANPDSTP